MRAKRLVMLLVVGATFALGVAVGGFITLTPSAKVVSQDVRAADDILGRWAPIGPLPFVRPAFGKAGSPPVPFSGRISSIAVDPNDSSHWLVGVGFGGVWESRDLGATWAPLTDGAATLATGDITFDPSNPQTIYVGTGEAQASALGIVGVGILKSTDGGQTWTVLGESSFARTSVKRLRVNPANPNELVAASVRGSFGRQLGSNQGSFMPAYGVFKSTDAGRTWTSTLGGQATALETDPANFNRQYAAIGERDVSQTAGASVNGVYRSTDAGQHWALITGPWGDSSPTKLASGVIELALAPSNPNTVYASVVQPVANSGTILGLYRTDNAWDDVPTWRQISIAQTRAGFGFPTVGYCVNCESHVISVHPNDPNILFAGGKEFLWRCTNCGPAPQWTNVTDGSKNNLDLWVDHRAIAWAGTRLILGNDGGIFSTTDAVSWQNHNTPIQTAMFYNGALHPTNPGFLIGGSRDLGFMVRRDGAALWAQVPTPPNISGECCGENEVALSSRHPETDWMVSSFAGNGIYRTLDGGKTAIRADTGMDLRTGASFVTPVRKCPADDDVFLAGSGRLWRTDNFFNSTIPSWSVNGPSAPDSTSANAGIYTINFATTDTSCNTYAYGNFGGEIRLTRDGGKTWVNLDPNRTLPLRGINSIAFDPANSDTMYIACTAFGPATGQRRHIYKTTNASATVPTWTNISPIEDVPFNVIVVDPRNSSLVYAGSDTGLWVSGDAGATWQKVGPDQGLPHAAVYDIEINPATNQTVVFTHGRGAFQLVPPDSVSASADARSPKQ